jgi:hypothetical protein
VSDYNSSSATTATLGDEVEIEYASTDEPAEELNAIGWSKDDLKRKAQELLECVASLRMDQKGKLEKVLKWRRQVEAVPEMRLRNINPLKNPSNVVPPLMQTYHQSLSAWITNYFATQPFLSVRSLKDDDQARLDATFLTKYLNILADSPSDLNLAPVKRMIADETALVGRCFVKVVWTRDSWAYKRSGVTDDTGSTANETVEMVYHEGPEVVVVRPEEAVFSSQWNNLYDLPMITHLYRLPRHELEALGARGIFDQEEVETVLKEAQTSLPNHQTTLMRDEGVNPAYVDDFFEIAEVWFYDDHDGDGIAEEYVWSIDLNTGCVLRADFNQLGSRMFETFRWIAHTYDLDGRGVGQALEGLQDEASTVHNIRNDSMKIVNMRMLQMPASVLKANSEELYPGKIWTNDTNMPIQPLQLGEVYPSSLEAEDRTWNLAAQATAFSEVQRGFSDQTLKSRDTWRGQELRMGQSQGITTTIADGMRETWNRVTLLILLQLIAHKDEVLAREALIGRLTADEQSQLALLLALDPKDVPMKFAFVANTIDGDRTQAAQMQGLQLVSGMYQQWVMGATPGVQMLFGPQGQMMRTQSPELFDFMLKNIVGSTKLLEKIMTLAGIDDAGSYLPNTGVWEYLIQMNEMMKEQQLQTLEAQTGQRRIGVGAPMEGMQGGGNGIGVPGVEQMGAGGGGGGGASAPAPVGAASSAGAPGAVGTGSPPAL